MTSHQAWQCLRGRRNGRDFRPAACAQDPAAEPPGADPGRRYRAVRGALCQVDPERPAAVARVQVRAALMIANDVARTPRLRDQAGSAQAVASLCTQMLALRQPAG